MSQGLLAYQRRFCRAQCKEKEEKVDRRRGGKTILRSSTRMDFASSIRAAEDRTRWIVVKSAVVPQRPRKVMG